MWTHTGEVEAQRQDDLILVGGSPSLGFKPPVLALSRLYCFCSIVPFSLHRNCMQAL